LPRCWVVAPKCDDLIQHVHLTVLVVKILVQLPENNKIQVILTTHAGKIDWVVWSKASVRSTGLQDKKI